MRSKLKQHIDYWTTTLLYVSSSVYCWVCVKKPHVIDTGPTRVRYTITVLQNLLFHALACCNENNTCQHCSGYEQIGQSFKVRKTILQGYVLLNQKYCVAQELLFHPAGQLSQRKKSTKFPVSQVLQCQVELQLRQMCLHEGTPRVNGRSKISLAAVSDMPPHVS